MKTKLIVIDLDETMVTKSRYPIRGVIESVNRLACRVFVLTGREEAQREQTLKDLDFARIVYDELSLMPTVDMNIAEYKRATVERLLEEYDVLAFVDDNDDNRAAVESLGVYVMTPDEFVDAAVNSGLFAENEDLVGYETREVSRVAPGFMAASARRGLRLHEEGESGDGLMPATVADARRMAEGEPLSVDKWRRIPGWIARHMMDLDAVDGDEITPGLVAMLLWGGGSSKSSARRTQAYAERMVERLAADEERAQPRKPNGQFDHGSDSGGGGDGSPAAGGVPAGGGDAAKPYSKSKPGSDAYANSTQNKMRKEQESVGDAELSSPERSAINNYTHNGHTNVNKAARGAPPPPLEGKKLATNQKQADIIDGVIQRSPLTSAPIVVERGTSIRVLGARQSGDIEGLVGAEFVDKGIVSTTLSSKVSGKFVQGEKDVTMVINVPKGSKAYAVPDELEYFNPMDPSNMFEREVLLPRGTKFKITNYDKDKNRVFVDVVPTSGRAATVDSEQRAPAPKKDQIKGSDTNPAGSAAGKTGDITLSESTNKALQNKADEHNTDMAAGDRPNWTRVRVGTLRSVYRRGSGAYSTSHRPGIGRAQWSMARVNAFLHLVRTGKPKNPKYVTDNDLLHADHPRRTDGEDRAQPRKPNGQFDHGSDSGGGGGGGGFIGDDDDFDGDTPTGVDPDDVDESTTDAFIGGEEYAQFASNDISIEQEEYLSELDGQTRDSLLAYTDTGHKSINRRMRGAPPPPITNEDPRGFDVDDLDSQASRLTVATRNAPPLDREVVLFRGVTPEALGINARPGVGSDSIADIDRGLKGLVGSEFTDKGIISTSPSIDIAGSFDGGVMMEIRAPVGARALAVETISSTSGEYEFLLPPGSRFNVVGVGKRQGKNVVIVELNN